MKTIGTKVNPAGQMEIVHYWWLENHGALACQLIGYLINQEAIKTLTDEEHGVKYSAKRIAMMACDLAEAMYAEMDARDWIMKNEP